MRTVRSSSRLLGGGVSAWGVSAQEAVCPKGGVCPGGVSQHALGQTPPTPCEQNDK